METRPVYELINVSPLAPMEGAIEPIRAMMEAMEPIRAMMEEASRLNQQIAAMTRLAAMTRPLEPLVSSPVGEMLKAMQRMPEMTSLSSLFAIQRPLQMLNEPTRLCLQQFAQSANLLASFQRFTPSISFEWISPNLPPAPRHDLLPVAEEDRLRACVIAAYRLAETGELTAGHDYLLEALRWAEGAQAAGYAWADELLDRCRREIDRYIRKYGIPLE